MTLTFGEKIKVILKRKGLTVKDLADKLGTSRQNMTNKFTRDNFTEKDMIDICEALGCTYKSSVVLDGEEL